jgi:hypothetical protein
MTPNDPQTATTMTDAATIAVPLRALGASAILVVVLLILPH